MWQVFCVSVWDTAKKKYGRACSVAKQIKFAYADSCKEYTPSYSVQLYKAQPGRTQAPINAFHLMYHNCL